MNADRLIQQRKGIRLRSDSGMSSTHEIVTVGGGLEVLIRPVIEDDAQALVDLFNRLSPESIYYRFLEVRKELSLREAEAFARVDYATSMALVGALPRDNGSEEIIAVARYAVGADEEQGVAEAAIVVEDRFQGRGLGTLLLLRLIEYARDHGVRAFQASIHQSNARILRFIEKSGLPTQKRLEGGVWEIHVELDDFPEV